MNKPNHSIARYSIECMYPVSHECDRILQKRGKHFIYFVEEKKTNQKVYDKNEKIPFFI